MSETRTQEQKLTGYLPIMQRMTLDCVASCIAVAHHNRNIVKSIEVRPGEYMPVIIHMWLATWEEASLTYPS
jgi:hypothetical protein